MTIENNNSEFVTSDFPLAVTLRCLGLKLIHMKRNINIPDLYQFFFSKDEIIRQLMDGYWNSALLVEPKNFFAQCRDLENQIKEYSRQKGND